MKMKTKAMVFAVGALSVAATAMADWRDEMAEGRGAISSDTNFVVTVSVDGTRPGRALSNVQQTLTLWHLGKGAYANTERNAEWDVTEFAEYVEIMGATGGNPERDCFKNPADRSTLEDYDFSRLVSGCRHIVRLGLKPYLKLGNVPGKFTSDYNGGAFSMNIRPPVDFSAYGRYMTACAKALLEAFGKDELLKWRFAVLTEYENADWFKAASGDAEETFRAYCRLYETTAAAFAGTISPDITIGAHAMAVTEGLWDERRFIRYAAERRLPLKFVTASFYDYRPGKFTRGMNVPRTIAHLRDAAVSAGLTNLFYGVDEGRILCGAKGADKGGAQLVLRIVGDTFQAAYDARIVKQIFDSGAKYFASWGYLSGPDTFFEGLPSVSFHVARESARFKGMRRLPAAVSGSVRKGTEADAVAALSPDGGTLRIMAYAFRNEQFAKGFTPFHFDVKLPAEWAGREIAVTRKQVDDDANWFDEWRMERAKRKIGNDRFSWSPDGPAPMSRIGLKSKADRELFLKEIEPKLRVCARLRPVKSTARADESGVLRLDATLQENSVVFFELDAIR